MWATVENCWMTILRLKVVLSAILIKININNRKTRPYSQFYSLVTLKYVPVREHLPVISPGIWLPASSSHTHLHRHRKRWASVTDVGPKLVQYWFNASCLLCLAIAIIGLEQFWASVNVRQWWDSYGSLARRLIKCLYIAYRASA